MTSVTVRLTDREIKMLKARTGERDASAALKAWVSRANPQRSTAELRTALRESRPVVLSETSTRCPATTP